jgi:hypothetical protein
MSTGRLVRKVVLTFLSLTVIVASITVLFIGMRAVMDIGGSCASGGPYVVANPCPEGVGWMLPVSIWVGLLSVAFYLGNDHGLPGPKVIMLAWPALFLSLGFNFWQYGLDPPPDGPDVVWSWIICGVLFVLMGGAPLVAILVSPENRRLLVWADADADADADDGSRSGRPGPRQVARAIGPPLGSLRRGASTSNPVGPSGRLDTFDDIDPGAASVDGPDRDLAEDLERLAALYRRGELTAGEFADAKARRMGREP